MSKIIELQKWLNDHEIEPIENLHGGGGDFYAFTEKQLLEFIAWVKKRYCTSVTRADLDEIIKNTDEYKANKTKS